MCDPLLRLVAKPKLLLCLLPALSAFLAGAPARAADVGVTSSSTTPHSEGERLFQTHCAPCHGPHGEGGKGPTLAQPHLPRASTEEAMLKIVIRGIEGTEMPRSRMEPEEVRQVVAWVWQLGKVATQPLPGDPAHGRMLYSTKGGCAQCHSLRGEGGAVGPDLTFTGLRRSPAYLRRALLEPEADVPQSFSTYRPDISLPENFLWVRLVTKDHRELAGVRLNEDTFSIQIRDLGNQIHSFAKSELAELHKDWGKSPMPAFGAVFNAAEIDDLVAFLASLRGDPSDSNQDFSHHEDTKVHEELPHEK